MRAAPHEGMLRMRRISSVQIDGAEISMAHGVGVRFTASGTIVLGNVALRAAPPINRDSFNSVREVA